MRHLALTALACTLSFAVAAQTARVYGIVQKGRAFSETTLAIAKGDTVRFTNEDGFLHQIFIHSPAFTVDSDEQRPGQEVDVQFPVAGSFRVMCAIHPKMALAIEVH